MFSPCVDTNTMGVRRAGEFCKKFGDYTSSCCPGFVWRIGTLSSPVDPCMVCVDNDNKNIPLVNLYI